MNTWGEADDTPAAWSHRVAVLADAGRVALTRPQLRALMPLTTNPDSDRSTTPPVLAYLQEPPFSEGGLADRIGAELKLGFGFGFKSGPQVGILDARKEIGPDPRLSYSAMPADQALAMGLMAEGPIGLTFDDTAVAGPAFANAMVSLAPIRLPTGQPAPDPMPSLEEHFLGVALRRYLDPDWVTPDGPVRLDGSQALWLDYDLGRLSHDAALLSCRIGATEVPLLKLVQTGEAFGIDIATAAADAGGGNAGVDWVTITALPAGATRLALLHQPVAPGRYSVAVFCSVPSQIRAGHSNQPLLLASVEWSPQQAAGAGEMILVAPGATPRPTRASAATFLAWTRTNRDFDRVVVKTAAEDRTIHWRNLVARRSSLTPQISLLLPVATGAATGAAAPAPTPLSAVWLRPSTWATPYPIHVHRHQALLGTRYASGLGRPIEVYAGATLAAAALIELAENGPLRQATNLRLVEFETPAAIICSASSVPPRYRSAYFDLKATGGSWERSIQLYLRFVGSPRYLGGFSQLRLKLGFWPGGDDDDATPVERAMTLNSLAGVAGAELTIVGGVITLVTLSADGVRIAMESAAVPVSAPDARGFMLDITTPDGPGEFWADVSMLHSRLPQPQPTAGADSPLCATDFDFDWLFSASEADPALAVRPVALAQMTEAQARIISISPLIPIEDID